MKKILSLILVMTLVVCLAACGKCDHDWEKATCDAPKTCAKCGQMEGEARGHRWADATCEAAKTCSVCGKADGTALGHNWADATEAAPKTCLRCGATEGEPLTQSLAGELVGTWVIDVYMDQFVEGFSSDAGLPIAFTFYADGTYVQVPYEKTFADSLALLKSDLCDYLITQAYEAAAKEGYSQKQADEAFYNQCGMTLREYAEAEVEKMGLDTMANSKTTGTYTVSGDRLTLEGRETPLTLTVSVSESTLQILSCDDESWIQVFGEYPVQLQRQD